MDALARAKRQPLFDAMADDVSWRWMGVRSWSKTFESKQQVVSELFGGVEETITAFSVQVHNILADGEHVVVEHTGHNTSRRVSRTGKLRARGVTSNPTSGSPLAMRAGAHAEQLMPKATEGRNAAPVR